MLVVEASTLTPSQRTVDSHETTVTYAGPVDTFAVARALIGTSANRAIRSSVPELTVTGGIVAHALITAVVGAGT